VQELHDRSLSELSRYSDSIWAGRFEYWILMEGIYFRILSDRLWGPRRLLYNG